MIHCNKQLEDKNVDIQNCMQVNKETLCAKGCNKKQTNMRKSD